jgi:hypothetical protein
VSCARGDATDSCLTIRVVGKEVRAHLGVSYEVGRWFGAARGGKGLCAWGERAGIQAGRWCLGGVVGVLAVVNELAKRSKGTRGMPRRGQAMKDVASCEKPWGGARFL